MSEAANGHDGTAAETESGKQLEPQSKEAAEPDTTTMEKGTGDATDEVADATDEVADATDEVADTTDEVADTTVKVTEDIETEEEIREANSVEPTELEQKIIKQIEYYFGDMNLPRDRFLQEQVKIYDGWVSLEIMVKFNRLKQLCTDFKRICRALRKSNSGLLEVSKDDLRIRRNPDVKMPRFTEERKKELLARTIYAKGFPLETTLDELMTFCEGYGETENVCMKKDIAKRFKGSVFAVFKDKNITDTFVKEEQTFQEAKLFIEYKEDYLKRKVVEKKMKKLEEEKTMRDVQEQKIEAEKKKQKESLPLGAILHLNNFSDDTEREDLANYFQDFGEIAWIDFNTGDKEARIRFKEPQKAKEALQSAKEDHGGKIEINNIEQEARILEGEEEMEHWMKVFKEQAEKRDKKKSDHNRKRGQQWGGDREEKSKKARSTGSKDDDSDEDEDEELSDHDMEDESEPKGML